MKKLFLTLGTIAVVIVFYIAGYVHGEIKYIPPHYHANFAVYIEGERVVFSDDKYMEDIAGCSISGEMKPQDRVHLHENNQDTIHVHAEGVAWGHFFSNIGYNFGEDFLSNDQGEMFEKNQEQSIRYILNGKKIENPFNKRINSLDQLLIVYGEEDKKGDQVLFNTVSDNAGEYNEKYDPGSCSGTNENGVLVLLRDFVAGLIDMSHSGH